MECRLNGASITYPVIFIHMVGNFGEDVANASEHANNAGAAQRSRRASFRQFRVESNKVAEIAVLKCVPAIVDNDFALLHQTNPSAE